MIIIIMHELYTYVYVLIKHLACSGTTSKKTTAPPKKKKANSAASRVSLFYITKLVFITIHIMTVCMHVYIDAQGFSGSSK